MTLGQFTNIGIEAKRLSDFATEFKCVNEIDLEFVRAIMTVTSYVLNTKSYSGIGEQEWLYIENKIEEIVKLKWEEMVSNDKEE